jgi:hypothetical protein
MVVRKWHIYTDTVAGLPFVAPGEPGVGNDPGQAGS